MRKLHTLYPVSRCPFSNGLHVYVSASPFSIQSRKDNAQLTQLFVISFGLVIHSFIISGGWVPPRAIAVGIMPHLICVPGIMSSYPPRAQGPMRLGWAPGPRAAVTYVPNFTFTLYGSESWGLTKCWKLTSAQRGIKRKNVHVWQRQEASIMN